MSIDTSSPPRSRGPARRSGASKPTRRGRRPVSFSKRLRRDRSLIIMTLPMVVLLLVFAYIPILGNVIAFQDYSPFIGIRDSPWAGMRQFERLLTDTSFWNAVKNTLVITAFQLVFYFPIPIALAILLNSILSEKVRTVIQSVVYLPHFFSWVVVVSVFHQILGGAGLLSQFTREFGLGSLDVMTNPDTFLFLITSQVVWKDAGWGIIVFLAALNAIDPALYESAAIDGAGKWRRTWHITLPGMRAVIVLLLILNLGNSLTVGFEQLILQRDAVGAGRAEVLDTFVYFTGVQNGDWSYAAAAGLVKGVVSMILVLGANKVAHLFGEAGVYQKA